MRSVLYLSIGDPLVSSQHCVITNGRLIDAQSTNGTQINKVKIAYGKPYILKPGDVVTIGETPLKIGNRRACGSMHVRMTALVLYGVHDMLCAHTACPSCYA